MKFVDACKVRVLGGRGGNGCIAFRREKFVAFGGPSGGDGGRGGDVVFVTDAGMSTLLDLSYAHTIEAEKGEHGQGKDCYGRAGRSRVVRVPVGTQVFDQESGELLFDLVEPAVETVVARGGKGGRGNIHFATPQERAPRRAEPGELGQERSLRLELKVMADVGLLGFPNVGKSTFISAVSRARPKIADYPFTTLVPQLGVVRVGEEASFVLADIPGLIRGAAEGAGLGHRFLKHLERTRALLHLITISPDPERDPMSDYDDLRHELAAFDPALAEHPEIVALSMADLPEVREAYPALAERFLQRGIALRLVSAATHEGVAALLADLLLLVRDREAFDAKEARAIARSTQKRPAPERPAIAATVRGPSAPKTPTSAHRAPRDGERGKSSGTASAAATKTPAKKAVTKKTAAKAPAAKKAVAKKATVKKPAAKKATVKKPAAKKATAKKPAAKKVTVKKPLAKKAPAKKPAPKKATAKKPVAKKAPAKKPAPKKAPAKKATTKRGARRR